MKLKIGEISDLGFQNCGAKVGATPSGGTGQGDPNSSSTTLSKSLFFEVPEFNTFYLSFSVVINIGRRRYPYQLSSV